MSTTERTKWDANRSKRRSCLDKKVYGRRHALRVARILRDKGDAQHAYPCVHDHPGRWHVGSDWEVS